MDGEHIFSASIVLVMVCAAFPTNAANTMAMNAGLDLLHGMGERGNSHMGARYKLLAKLRSCVMPEAMNLGATSAETCPGESHILSPIETEPAAAVTAIARISDQEPAQESMPQLASYDQASKAEERMAFPDMHSSLLDEPFFDDTVTSGMDFALWEEGFAFPTMDLDLAWVHGQPYDGDHATDFMHESSEM